MGSRNKVVTLLFAVVLACTSFAASAQQVDTSLSANPTATISAIDSIGTPLSDQATGEVRGEAIVIPAWMAVMGWFSLGLVTYAHYLGVTNYDYLKTQPGLFDLYLTTGGLYLY